VAKKELMIRVKVISYWIDYSVMKAYCVVEYIDKKQDDKHTNMFLIESKYNGQ